MNEKTAVTCDADSLLRIALDVGDGMIKCGGEISRVEDTVERICKAYGAVHVEVFSIMSLIVASVRMPDGSYASQTRRVRSASNNFYKLEIYNGISRQICSETPPLDEVDRMIKEKKTKKLYPLWLRPIAAALVSSTFAILFGGNLKDSLAAAVVGAIVISVDIFWDRRINEMAKTVLNSLVGGLLACIAARLGLCDSVSTVMIGTIMLHVPGLYFGTALRDLLCGDLLAGLLKTVQACLSTLMMAFGYLLAMIIVGGI